MAILRVDNLKTHFYTSHGVIKAVDGVSFDIRKGEVFGLVGESGSGKTLTALSILKLIPFKAKVLSGKIFFNDINLLDMGEEGLRSIRGAKISMVFQEPSTSFNPVFTIGEQVAESIIAHKAAMGKREAKELALEYFEKVHIREPLKVFYDYPHQLSGGTKQRAMIAMALVNSPELVMLDEPTTALDMTIQAQILDLLEEIRNENKLSMLFISHDFGIIARMCDRVAVMNKGRIVELNDKSELFHNPTNPYTRALLESVKALS